MYLDVFRSAFDIIQQTEPTRMPVGQRSSFRLAQREVTDRPASPKERRPVSPLPGLGQPREADLEDLRELLGRQHLIAFGGPGRGVTRLRGHDGVSCLKPSSGSASTIVRARLLSRPSVEPRRYQDRRNARGGSVRNWSSLADLGFAPIAGAPFIENRKVLWPDLADQRPNRYDVDVGRYAP